MLTRRRSALASLSLVLGAALGGCSSGSAVEAGQVVAAADHAVPAGGGEVRLPTGTLHLSTAPPVSSVDAGDTADGTELEETDGIAYVGVGWELTTDGPPAEAAGVLTGATERPSLALVDGEERIELGEAVGTDAVFAAVPESLADSGHVEVTFDGVTQQVSLADGTITAGEAEALYADAPAAAEEQDCAVSEPEPGVRLDHLCGALLVELPWVPEVGWAPDGGSWAAVRLETRLGEAEVGEGADAAAYTVTGADVTATLAGQQPVATVPQPTTAPGDTGAWLVFPMPAGPAELAVTATYAADRASGPETQPASRDFTATSSVTLGS